MQKGRFIDLSHKMFEGKEEYGLKQDIFNTVDKYDQYKVSEDTWYIMQNITMSSHCGTHIELPYHHIKSGLDAADFPIGKLTGEAVLLDFRHKKAWEEVTLDDVLAYEGKIQEGDIVFFYYGLSDDYYEGGSHIRPYVSETAMRWLIDNKKIKIVGTDASGFEKKGAEDQPIHQMCLANDIPIIEFAHNLKAINKERFMIYAFPLPISLLDSSPIRLIAYEE
jgi:arylformamidase